MPNTIAIRNVSVRDGAVYVLSAVVRLVGRIRATRTRPVVNFEIALDAANGGRVLIVEMPRAATSSEKCDLDRCVAPVLANQPNVLVDMSRLLRVDSSGLAAILGLLRTVGAMGGSLKLCGMTKSVRMVFELTRLHHVFDIYGTVDEALQAFGECPA